MASSGISNYVIDIAIAIIVFAVLGGTVGIALLTNTTGNWYIDHDNNASTPNIFQPNASAFQLTLYLTLLTVIMAVVIIAFIRSAQKKGKR